MFKISVRESSVLFTSVISQLLIGIVFTFFIIKKRFCQRINIQIPTRYFTPLVWAGVIMAVEYWATNQALTMAPVGAVMATKRTMPMCAFIIGMLWFKERQRIFPRIIATLIMILGVIIISAD